MFLKARRLGIDTIQFLDHQDQWCMASLGIEIVDTRYPGFRTCGPEFRGGWKASEPFECKETGCVALTCQ